MAAPSLALDALYDPAPSSAVASAGYVARLRYLRVATTAQVQEDHAAGLGVGLIFETTATRALGGEAAGTTDGHTAVRQAQALGAPPGVPLFVNVGDFAATWTELPAILAYLEACIAAIGTHGYVGGYGSRWLIDHLISEGVHALWWQNAMSDEGETGDVVDPAASLYQRVKPTLAIPGATCSWDEDVIVKPIPWWTAPKEDPMLQVNTPNNGIWLLSGSMYVWIDNPTVLTSLRNSGALAANAWTIDQTQHDRLVAASKSVVNVSGLTATQAEQLSNTAAAVAKIQAGLEAT